MGRFDSMSSRMFELWRNLNLYKMSFLGLVLVYAIMLVLAIPLIIGIITIPFSPSLGLELVAIFGIIDFIAWVFLSQIPVAGVILVSEGKKISAWEAIKYVWKRKILKMGLASILVGIILLVILALFGTPLIMGIITRSASLVIGGLFLVLIGLLIALVIGYFFWPIQVVAFKEEKVIGAIGDSFQIMKNAGFPGVGIFLVTIIVSTIISWIINLIFQANLILALTGQLGALVLYLIGMFITQVVVLPISTSGMISVYEVIGESKWIRKERGEKKKRAKETRPRKTAREVKAGEKRERKGGGKRAGKAGKRPRKTGGKKGKK